MNGPDAAATVLSEQFDMEFLHDDAGEDLRSEALPSKGLCFVQPMFQPEAADDGGGCCRSATICRQVRVTLEELEAKDPRVVAPALRALAERAKEHGAECRVGVYIDCPQDPGRARRRRRRLPGQATAARAAAVQRRS